MKRQLALVTILFLLAGCATVNKPMNRPDLLGNPWIYTDIGYFNPGSRCMITCLPKLYYYVPKKYISELMKMLRVNQYRYLGWKYGSGDNHNTLVCYLFNEKIEKLVEENECLEESTRLRLLKLIRSKFANPENAGKAVIITKLEIRQKLRMLIAKLLPTLPVLAYEELGPDMNIQPLERVKF